MGRSEGPSSPTAPGQPPAALNPQSQVSHILSPTSLVFLHPISTLLWLGPSGTGCPCSPWPWERSGVASARTGAEAQLSAWILAGILAPANPRVAAQPSSQSRAATWPFLPHAASTNHNQATLWSGQLGAATWHFPTTNHVLPLVSAAASPLQQQPTNHSVRATMLSQSEASAFHLSQPIRGSHTLPGAIKPLLLLGCTSSRGDPRMEELWAFGRWFLWKRLPPAGSWKDVGGAWWYFGAQCHRG